jgi:hypothetical protein
LPSLQLATEKHILVANPTMIKKFACGNQKFGSMLYNDDGFQSPILQ